MSSAARATRVAVVCVLVAAGLTAVVAVIAERAGSAGSAQAFEGPLMPAHLHAAAFGLRDQDGRVATLEQYRGQVVVLTFLHSQCRSACPIIAQQIRGALDNLGAAGRDAHAVAISVEPEQDTVANVRRFLRTQHVAGSLRYLTGSRSTLARVWKAYAIAPQKGHADHSAFVILIDRNGYERVGYPFVGITPENLTHDIRLLLAG